MRYLGLDLGTKSLGISISDKTNTLATPLTVLKFDFEDYNNCFQELKTIINENDIDTVVLGLPKNIDGSIGFAGNRSLKFKNILEENGIKVILEDERFTTKISEDIIHMNGKNVKNTKDKIDAIAASIILESFLKRCSNDAKK